MLLDQTDESNSMNYNVNYTLVSTTENKEVQTVNNYTNELALKKKIKFLQQKLRRKENKINNLQGLLKNLRGKGLIDTEPGNIIENYFSGKYLQ